MSRVIQQRLMIHPVKTKNQQKYRRNRFEKKQKQKDKKLYYRTVPYRTALHGEVFMQKCSISAAPQIQHSLKFAIKISLRT